jgi:hypothetical protein
MIAVKSNDALSSLTAPETGLFCTALVSSTAAHSQRRAPCNHLREGGTYSKFEKCPAKAT